MQFDVISDLLDKNEFKTALEYIENYEKSLGEKLDKKTLFYKTELNGFRIDLGLESFDVEQVNKGLEFFVNNSEFLLKNISEASYYYNLANANHGIFTMKYSDSPCFINPQVMKDYGLQNVLNHFWMSFKKISDFDNNLKNQLLVNFGNSLNWAFRSIESLQFFNMVLEKEPYFPQANISKAECLLRFIDMSKIPISIALLSEMYQCYKRGIDSGKLPKSILEESTVRLNQVKSRIEEYGFSLDGIESEIAETKAEYGKLSAFRKFTLSNHLSLNEHSLYCFCSQAEKDDIRIGIEGYTFPISRIAKMELVVNRIKSEFGLARKLYYESSLEESEDDLDLMLTEMYEGEAVNKRVELMRTSYRICYGVLDKIAKGICRLYDLAKPSDNTLFEAFWSPRNEKRWTKINSVENPFLTALYSIACDLNTRNGEMKEFKEWRNRMEHNILILKDRSFGGIVDDDIFDDDFVQVVNYDDFDQKTLHLLQLVRAAILNFIYMVRYELIEDIGNKKGIIIGYK